MKMQWLSLLLLVAVILIVVIVLTRALPEDNHVTLSFINTNIILSPLQWLTAFHRMVIDVFIVVILHITGTLSIAHDLMWFKRCSLKTKMPKLRPVCNCVCVCARACVRVCARVRASLRECVRACEQACECACVLRGCVRACCERACARARACVCLILRCSGHSKQKYRFPRWR